MKKLKKGCDPLVDKDAFQRRNGSGRRTLICLPATLHHCIDEIRYRENTTLRNLISTAMATCVNKDETMRAPEAALHLCSIADDVKVSSSVQFTENEYHSLRAVNHFWKVTYSEFVVDVLIRYISENYGDTHPDIPGMDKIKAAFR